MNRPAGVKQSAQESWLPAAGLWLVYGVTPQSAHTLVACRYEPGETRRRALMIVDHEKASKIAEAYAAAWNSGSPHAVASFYAPDGQIVINRGRPWTSRQGIADMAAGFFADVPDLRLVCDDVRCAGDHVAYFWTFTGTHAATKCPLRVVGWEEWDLDADLKVVASRGWYDAADYERRTTGG